MNKLIIVLLILSVFGITTTIKAQKTISQAEYEAIVDYINCQFAELSLKDQTNQPHYAAFQAEVANNCNEPVLMSFLKTRKPTPLVNNLKLVYAISQYKEDYTPDNRKLYETLANKLFKEELVVNFGNQSKRSTSYPALRANLRNYLKEKLPYNENEVQVVEPSEGTNNGDEPDLVITLDDPEPETTTTRETEPEATTTTTTNNTNNTSTDNLEDDYIPKEQTPNGTGRKWMGIGLMLILLIIMAYLFLKYYETNFKKGQSPTNPANDMRFSRNRQIAALQQEVKSLKDKNQALEEEIVKLKGIIADLEEKAAQNKEAKTTPKDEPTVPENPVITPPPVVQEVFYMPIPSSDGSFHDSLKTNSFEPTESVYRFEMIGNGQAEFRLVTEMRTMQRAINGFDNYIRPVCRSSNAFSLSATQVVTDKPGIVERDGGVWKLLQRAIIHYE